MAARLEEHAAKIPGIEFLSKRQVNSVFLKLPPSVADELRARGWMFYTFIGAGGARFMCSWDTTEEDVDQLAADLTELMTDRR